MNQDVEQLLECGAVLLEPCPARMGEYGKRFFDGQHSFIGRYLDVLKDIAKLAVPEMREWAGWEAKLHKQGVPTAVTNGLGRFGAQSLIDHINGKTSFTMPTVCALHLTTGTAPTETTLGTDAAYTGYVPLAQQANWNAATAAQPSVGANTATITFGACTAGSSTLTGFELTTSTTVNAGSLLWYGTLASTVISTTQTPPTVAAGALTVSLAGS